MVARLSSLNMAYILDRRDLPVSKTLLSCVKQECGYFDICPKQVPTMEGVVLNRYLQWKVLS